MAPLSGKSKSKGREGRRSRSRNTTPSSNVSIPITTTNISTTGYLDIDVGKIMIPTNLSYNDILERHGGGGGIPEVKHLEQMADELKILSQLAETREQACNGGMRELVKRRIERVQEERQKEQDDRQREEKESLKRAAEEDEEARGRKGLKSKKQKKDRSTVREERPLAVGAHGLARQDGLDLPSKGTRLMLPFFFYQTHANLIIFRMRVFYNFKSATRRAANTFQS